MSLTEAREGVSFTERSHTFRRNSGLERTQRGTSTFMGNVQKHEKTKGFFRCKYSDLIVPDKRSHVR